jgi:hypothetical protein
MNIKKFDTSTQLSIRININVKSLPPCEKFNYFQMCSSTGRPKRSPTCFFKIPTWILKYHYFHLKNGSVLNYHFSLLNAPPQQPNQSKWTPAIICSQRHLERTLEVAGARRSSDDELHGRLFGNSRTEHKNGTSTLKFEIDGMVSFHCKSNCSDPRIPSADAFARYDAAGLVPNGHPVINHQRFRWGVTEAITSSPRHITIDSWALTKSTSSNRHLSARMSQWRLSGEEIGEELVCLDPWISISHHFITLMAAAITRNRLRTDDGKHRQPTIYFWKHNTIHTLIALMFSVEADSNAERLLSLYL